MKDLIQTLIIEFNNHGSRIYGEVLSGFKNSVRDLSRREDENVFRLQAAKFSGELKRLLEVQAKKIIEKVPQLRNELTRPLTDRINFYSQEFSRHTSSY